MGIDKNFEQLVLRLYTEEDKEIFSFEYESKKYWLKKARATKSFFSHKLFYKIFPIEVLLPVEEKSNNESIKFETTKIKSLKDKGVNTPNISYQNDNFFVLEDCGKTANSNIRKKDISKNTMYYFIDKLLLEISKIHNLNEFHGGAQARNFTYKDEKIFVIDLEDSFDKSIELKVLQLRDLILFLLSLTKTRASFDVDYEYVINKYIELCPMNRDFKIKLKELSQKISFLITISQISFVNKIIGRDGQGFFKLFLILKNLKG
ncbi:kinase [Arcobacter sp. LA11]|uniref:kinase n=1 Tax=Arcobacter sp. LA11 TaxID=1898176 RepID=UPI000933696C|nr:kinase [Arcobacter sp. LA11]